MAGRAKFVKSESGIVELMKSESIRSALRPAAEQTLARAQASAPFESGEYRGSLHIEDAELDDRAALLVGSNAPHALIVEANTGNLARAIGG
jgi:hypothetical protein